MPSSDASPRRFFRRAAVLLGLAALLLGTLYAATPWLAARLLPPMARGWGVEIRELRVARPGLQAMTVVRLVLARDGVEMTARDARLTYSPASLLAGRLRSLTVAELAVTVRPAAAETVPSRTAPPSVPPAPRTWFAAVPVEHLEITRLSVAVPVLEFAASGRFELAEHADLELDARSPAAAEGFALEARLFRDGRLDARLAERSGRGAPVLAVASRVHGQHLAVDGRLALEGFPLQLAAGLAGLPAGDGGLQVDFEAALPWPVPESLDWAALEVAGTAGGHWRPASGGWHLSRSEGTWQLSAGVLSGHAEGQVAVAGRPFAARLEGARFDPARGAGTGELYLADPAPADADPYLGMTASLTGTGLSLAGRAAVREALLDLALERGWLPAGAGALAGTFDVTLPWPLPDSLQARGEGTVSGAWRDPHGDLEVSEITGTWRVNGRDVAGRWQAGIGYRSLRAVTAWSATAQPFDPVPVVRGTVAVGQLSVLSFTLTAAPGALRASGGGRLDIRESLADAVFEGWSEGFDVTGGGIDLDATLEIPDEGAWSGRINIGLDGVDGHYGDVVVAGLRAGFDAAVSAEGWSVAPAAVTATRLETGVGLTDVRAETSVAGDRLAVRGARAQALGGEVTLDDFELVLESGSARTVARLAAIDLAQVLALEGEQVSGTGVIDGSLPITLADLAPSIQGGHVRARSPGGLLRVSPALAGGTGQPGLDFALRALQDFRYDVLEAGVGYTTAGDLTLAVHLEGRNPEIESGRPIHYNVTVNENVPTLLEALRLQSDISRGIERRLND